MADPTTTTTTTTDTKLFRPLHISPTLTTAHRIVMAPLTRLRNDASTHTPLPMAVSYYLQRACVPGTLLISEACQISPRHGGMPHAPGIWSAAHVAAWRSVVDAFTYLIKALREMGVGYLHVVESRVVNNEDKEKTEGIEFALEAWGKDKPVLVAGGFNGESARKAVDEEYKDWDVGVVFGRYFLSTPDLVYRLKNGLEPNPYDRSTFYTPIQEKGYLDYPFSEEFEAEKTRVGA
ncbi:putative nadh:flavin oxidoreductase nadh oxidase [Diplodia seriata]|uniref:Putative nadh:flavin oxidoreductase nadh oxidase n=1 Tax=Diplodia seriata TaxID=420778 RepID=A0A0G2GJ30_9PEZI|nr:putative nadh:flavin oxidoreductase nadh oxidase [Diplodia seriata]